MKKTKYINLNAMRKCARAFVVAPIALAVLSGCSESTSDQHNAKYLKIIDECQSETELSVAQCEAAYQTAVAKAQSEMPRYSNMNECGQYYGECRRSSNGDFFVPLMAGYLAASMMDDLGRSYRSSYYDSHRYYRNRPSSTTIINNYSTNSSSNSYSTNNSSSNVTKSTPTKPKPIVTKTSSRGGFGSKAASKSSWGSSSKSSSRSSSWGG
jgi:uncharacterized protein YgiB involved in biofilm formation